jgi:hypothetical protein
MLSLVSFPLWVMFLAFWIATSTPDRSWISCLPGMAGYILFAVSARLAASIAQCVFCRSAGLPGNSRLFAFALIPALACWMAAALVKPASGAALPGYHLGQLLAGHAAGTTLPLLGCMAFLLSAVEAFLLYKLTYSGICGPQPPGTRPYSSGSVLLIHAAWPPPLWRVSLLGWLRNRPALLLLLWGASYSFLFMYFSYPEGAFEFIAFTFVVQVFHSYIRGNLLGVDHRAAWYYYMLPSPVWTCVQAKNQTLSVIQGIMVAAVLLPGLLHPVPSIDLASWIRILSYACSSILIGEIGGGVLSLIYPEPIERTSHYSGGMATGGLIVPVLQVIFLAVFMTVTELTRLFLAPALLWSELVFTPALLIAIRSLLLPGVLQKMMINRKTRILASLSVFSS